MNATQLAERWIDAWNRRDLTSLLALYAVDAEVVSPFVTLLSSVRGASLHGKPALRAHFEASWAVGNGGRMELEDLQADGAEARLFVRGGCADRMEMAFQLDSAGRIRGSMSRILRGLPTGGAA